MVKFGASKLGVGGRPLPTPSPWIGACVTEAEKLFYDILTMSFSLLVFPAPLAFGAAIDSACVLFDSKCGVQGRCKLYDHSKFRLRLHGGVSVVKVAATIFYLIGWYMSRKYSDMYEDIEKRNQREKEGCDDNERNEKKEGLLGEKA